MVVDAASSSASTSLEVPVSLGTVVLSAAVLLKIFAGLILLKHAVRLASTKLAKAAKDKFKNTFLVIMLINFNLLPCYRPKKSKYDKQVSNYPYCDNEH